MALEHKNIRRAPIHKQVLIFIKMLTPEKAKTLLWYTAYWAAATAFVYYNNALGTPTSAQGAALMAAFLMLPIAIIVAGATKNEEASRENLSITAIIVIVMMTVFGMVFTPLMLSFSSRFNMDSALQANCVLMGIGTIAAIECIRCLRKRYNYHTSARWAILGISTLLCFTPIYVFTWLMKALTDCGGNFWVYLLIVGLVITTPCLIIGIIAFLTMFCIVD